METGIEAQGWCLQVAESSLLAQPLTSCDLLRGQVSWTHLDLTAEQGSVSGTAGLETREGGPRLLGRVPGPQRNRDLTREVEVCLCGVAPICSS